MSACTYNNVADETDVTKSHLLQNWAFVTRTARSLPHPTVHSETNKKRPTLTLAYAATAGSSQAARRAHYIRTHKRTFTPRGRPLASVLERPCLLADKNN